MGSQRTRRRGLQPPPGGFRTSRRAVGRARYASRSSRSGGYGSSVEFSYRYLPRVLRWCCDLGFNYDVRASAVSSRPSAPSFYCRDAPGTGKVAVLVPETTPLVPLIRGPEAEPVKDGAALWNRRVSCRSARGQAGERRTDRGAVRPVTRSAVLPPAASWPRAMPVRPPLQRRRRAWQRPWRRASPDRRTRRRTASTGSAA